MSSNLVVITTGHLGCGQWRLKDLDGLFYLAHPQPFSRRNEFRIGPDQVTGVTVEQDQGKILQVKIDLTDDRYCRAEIKPHLLPSLEKMVEDRRVVPLAENQQTNWMIGLSLFVIVCILVQLYQSF